MELRTASQDAGKVTREKLRVWATIAFSLRCLRAGEWLWVEGLQWLVILTLRDTRTLFIAFSFFSDSDLNATSEDTGVEAQDNKLKLMLGISLLTLLLFTILLASSSALLFKLKTT